MASTILKFGKTFFNSSQSVWSIRRQVLSLPLSGIPSEVFVSPNTPITTSTITVPLRGDSTIPSGGFYDNIKVVVFKGFEEDFINTGNSKTNWLQGNDYSANGQTGMNFLCKESDSSLGSAGFQYGVIDDLIIQPLAYFSGTAFIDARTDTNITFRNPIFTDDGQKLENWLPSTTDEEDYENKLFVGIYHDSSEVTWTDSNGSSCDLNWARPNSSSETYQYAVLTLDYGSRGVKYYINNEWKDCEVHYYDGSNWKQCEVNYYDNGWKSIG